MLGEIFYDAGPVITKAKMVGFCAPETSAELCTHRSCGWKEVQRVCPKCGNEISEDSFQSNMLYFNKNTGFGIRDPSICRCDDNGKDCGGNLFDGKVILATKVKCTRSKYKGLSITQLCNPEQQVKYATIRVVLAGDADWHTFVVDLEAKEFINKEMSIHYFGKGNESWSVGPTVKTRNLADLNVIINKDQVIDAIANLLSK